MTTKYQEDEEADRIAVAASRALQHISSAAHARSLTQPSSTPTKTNTTANQEQQDNDGSKKNKDDILDIFMSPDKPKSRLRQLAESSAKKFNSRSSITLQSEGENNPAEHFVLNLGIPKPKPPADYKLPTRRSIGPRRSSNVSKRATSPAKSSKPPIEALLDDLDILDRTRSTKSPFEPSKKLLPKSKPATRSNSPMKSPVSRSSNPPTMSESRRMTCSDIPKDQDDKKNVQRRTSNKSDVQPSQGESDYSSSDSFDLKVLLVKAETEEEEPEEDQSTTVNPVRPTTRKRANVKPKRVIADSDEEDGDSRSPVSTSFSSSKSPKQSTNNKHTAPRRSQRKSSLRVSHSKQKSSTINEIINVDDDTESDDSIEIEPSRALQFQKLRSQAFTSGTYSTSCDPLSEPIGTTNTIPLRNNRRVIISSDESSSGEEEIQIIPKDNHPSKSFTEPISASKVNSCDSSAEEEIQIRPNNTLFKLSPKSTPASRRRQVSSSDQSSSDQERIQIKLKDNRPKYSPKPIPTSEADKPKAKAGGGVSTKSRGGQSKKPTAKAAPRALPKQDAASRPFVELREEMAQDLLLELNKRVFGLQLPPIQLVWSKRLNTTAGRAHYVPQKDTLGNRVVFVKVELAVKVVDDIHKLRNTLAHELCHVACWFIDKQLRENHGRFFKAWGRKVHQAMPDIVVTTKHSYQITYKFQWGCNRPDCTNIYGRHSDSIKPERQRCMCGGGLVAILRNGKAVVTPSTPLVETPPADTSVELLIDLYSPTPLTDSEGRPAYSIEQSSPPSSSTLSRDVNPYLSELEEIDPADFLNPYLSELILLDPRSFHPTTTSPSAPEQHSLADDLLVNQLTHLSVLPS